MSVSGVRGIVGKTISPQVIVRYVSAFASVQKGTKIIIGRDSRVSGPWIMSIAEATLVALGYKVVLFFFYFVILV